MSGSDLNEILGALKCVPVKSSNLAEVGYHEASETLVVVYKSGKRYVYPGVPADAAQGVYASESVGKAVRAAVQGLGFREIKEVLNEEVV